MKGKNIKIIIMFIITFTIFGFFVFILSNFGKNDLVELEDMVSSQSQSKLEKFKYEFNPHVISKEYIDIYGADIKEIFYNFCDAVLAGKDRFKCPSIEKFNIVLTISRNCLPIACQYVDKNHIKVANGEGLLVYKISKQELMNEIARYKDKISNLIVSSIPYREDDFVMAAELLTAVSNKDNFDDKGLQLENSLEICPYRAIMNNIGICQEISGEYIYYLLQIGINATNCSALSRDKSYSHEWVVVELDNHHYHIDPTFSIQHRGSLAFFCMTDIIREKYGDFPVDNFSFAGSATIKYIVDSEKFKELWGAEAYTIDHEHRKIHMKMFYTGEEKDYYY